MNNEILEKIKNIQHNIGDEVFIIKSTSNKKVGEMCQVYKAVIKEIKINITNTCFINYQMVLVDVQDYFKRDYESSFFYDTEEDAQMEADEYNKKDLNIISQGGSLFGQCN